MTLTKPRKMTNNKNAPPLGVPYYTQRAVEHLKAVMPLNKPMKLSVILKAVAANTPVPFSMDSYRIVIQRIYALPEIYGIQKTAVGIYKRIT